MTLRRIVVGFGVFCLCFTGPADWGQQSASGSSQASVVDTPVPPPPMGWSSWNSFSNRIDSQITMQQAKAMVDTGMAKRGYRYINIDEGWWLGTRDINGNITVDPRQWPAIAPGERAGDMANIVRYIHGLGLKAGIYTDAGEGGCSFYSPDLGPPMPHTGSEGHYKQDFLQFAKWGFDYVKVDWCGGGKENLDPDLQYAEVGRAIRRAVTLTGHPLYYSICNWGGQSPWTWGPGSGGVAANIWRTSGDIVAPIVANSPNANRKASYKCMLGNFDQGIHPEAQHTGFYNDPDMMVLGMPGLTDAQNRVHLTLWAISGAPLLVGADLTTLSQEMLSMLNNPDVVAIDQDSIGLQAVRIPDATSKVEIWAKKLAGTQAVSGRRAVVLLNRSGVSATVSLQAKSLGLEAGRATLRDVWADKDLGVLVGAYSAMVPAEGALLLLIEGTELKGTRYDIVDEAATVSSTEGCQTTTEWAADKVMSQGSAAWLRVSYTNTTGSPRLLAFRVNGERQSMIALPSVASGTGSVVLEAKLKEGANQLEFESACVGGVGLRSVAVLPFGM